MGLIMSCASCAVNACMCTTACCCRASSPVTKVAAKTFYFSFLMAGAGLALLMNRYGDDIPDVHKFFSFKSGCGDNLSDCFGLQAIFRISFATMLFFLGNLVLSAMSEAFHLGLWGLKTVVWLLLVVITFFMPYDVFSGYAQASRVISVIYLVVQVVVLIDMAYRIHEGLAVRIEKRDSELSREYASVGICQNFWKLVYLFILFVLVGGSCAVLFWLFNFVRHNEAACTLDKGLLSITFISGIVLVLMGATTYFGERGTVAPAVMFAYCTWLCWSAMCSNPEPGCSPIEQDRSAEWAKATGILITLLSFAWMTYSSTSSIPGLAGGEDPVKTPTATSSSAEAPLLPAKPNETAAEKADRKAEARENREEAADNAAAAARSQGTERHWVFHLVMALGAIYMAMVLSNWQVDALTARYVSNSVSESTMWVKISSQWFTILLFIWTMIAPKLFPDREFR